MTMADAPAREDVLIKGEERMSARAAMKADSDIAKAQIAPGALASRWKTRQKNRLDSAKAKGKQAARDNAPLIAVAAAGLALFAARRPIARTVNKLKQRKARK